MIWKAEDWKKTAACKIIYFCLLENRNWVEICGKCSLVKTFFICSEKANTEGSGENSLGKKEKFQFFLTWTQHKNLFMQKKKQMLLSTLTLLYAICWSSESLCFKIVDIKPICSTEDQKLHWKSAYSAVFGIFEDSNNITFCKTDETTILVMIYPEFIAKQLTWKAKKNETSTNN